jgi:putative oxidoreductase
LKSKKTFTMLRSLAQLYLRLALGSGFFIIGLDRLGAWGPYGKSWVSWGDWKHFSAYAHELMHFLPYGLAETLAVLATFVEVTAGPLLILGCFTRWTAITTCGLTLCFAIAMSITNGIISPINYSVFTASAASLLLAAQPDYRWSIDRLRKSSTSE